MKIAIEGCCHGELEKIYGTLSYIEQTQGIVIDLLLICGDFQAIRNEADMESIACPAKYRRMGGFYKYYSGELRAPIPTIFIGGNHEASNYLWELYHGGWVAPNIYFLGFAGVVNFGGIRIGGVSGIFKQNHFNLGHFERQPYGESDQRSIYHVRKYNVFRLMQIQSSLDIFLSHDWPRGMSGFGNTKRLVTRRPFFAEEVRTNTLGSPPAEALLKKLRPSYWFSAHLHVKYAALYPHHEAADTLSAETLVTTQASATNPDAIDIGLDEDDDDDVRSDKEEEATVKAQASDTQGALGSSTSVPDVDVSNPAVKVTRFLALDKCLPGRDFLQVIDVPSDNNLPKDFYYDEEWLAIMRSCNEYLSLSRDQKPLPDDSTIRKRVAEEKTWVEANVGSRQDGLRIPRNFQPTAAPYSPSLPFTGREKEDAHRPYLNPQTFELCDILSINNKINPTGQGPAPRRAPRPPPQPQSGEVESAGTESGAKTEESTPVAPSMQNGGLRNGGEGQKDVKSEAS
ncbi:DBR1-domain-containing protein [Gonapodya prolifera JEL478]|uniref:DBR1-domain-containing protein n=1 Tax=Gonapodya prolifera (strain JEL478) TaxID=1344416 RepID=A0A139AT35_GONPJ|nr:DBR1-domain-containing protein [Gonapodya prolifera JEL478]|eukprot:KXS19892.1 DBR1-domain-containing protein [Gonapodya prolifera JEL478]